MTVVPGSVDTGYVHALDDSRATDPRLAGSKAAALASTLSRGLPVLPGLVVTTRAHTDYVEAGRELTPTLRAALERAWEEFSDDGRLRVVVRSSSTVEDVSSSSMAGRFRSILDVRTREQFLAAVREVWVSADQVAESGPPSPMGVLVQHHLDPDRAGVMFGVDPVTGARSTIAVDAVVGGPDKLVSGRVSAQHYVLSRRGRLLSVDNQPVRWGRHVGERLLHAGELLSLARLARTTERVFGSPQDVEWAITADGTLRLLQSRPVTATSATAPAAGPVLGPGPLAESFPDPLGELEIDLWVRPLRSGVEDALREAGAVPARRVDRSPVVTTVHGRVAADLELFGYVRTRSALRFLDPRPPARQIRAAWRTGSLRARLLERAGSQVSETDEWLGSVEPALATAEELLEMLDRAGVALRGLHHTEVLCSTLLPPAVRTAASVALEVTGEPNVDPDDPGLLRRHPVLLSLVPPSLQGRAAAPPVMPGRVGPGRDRYRLDVRPDEPLPEREQLRLRVRWVQELTVYAARQLGRLLAARGLLDRAEDVSLFTLTELGRLLADGRGPEDVRARRSHELALAFSPPLPAEFRLGGGGELVPVTRRGARPTGYGTPAGGGRGVGIVSQGSVRRPPSPGDVLVVRTLEPGLAGWLPGLAGLVSETGAALSHLAILAREYGVPTVVGVPDALGRFAPGTRLLVDGGTGEVRVVEGEASP